MRQYSSTSYTREKASSRTSCRDSTAGSQLLSQTLPSLAGFRAGAAASSSVPHKTQEVSSPKPHQKPVTVHETTTNHHQLCRVGWEVLTLFCFPELFSLVCGHSFPTSSIFMSATGTVASGGAMRTHSLILSLSSLALRPQACGLTATCHSGRGFPPPSHLSSFSPSPTFFQQALDGGRVHPLLHIPVVQHFVVG